MGSSYEAENLIPHHRLIYILRFRLPSLSIEAILGDWYRRWKDPAKSQTDLGRGCLRCDNIPGKATR